MSHLPYYGEEDPLYSCVVTRPQAFEEFLYSGDKRNSMTVAYGGRSGDVLDQPDTISLEELEEPPYEQMSRAGIDPLTATDDFINMNGDTRYVTDLYPEEA